MCNKADLFTKSNGNLCLLSDSAAMLYVSVFQSASGLASHRMNILPVHRDRGSEARQSRRLRC